MVLETYRRARYTEKSGMDHDRARVARLEMTAATVTLGYVLDMI